MTPSSADHTERSTLAACIAHVAGTSASDVPLDRDEQHAWLAERGLGLVPVADAATFRWAAPWIARRTARDGSGPRAVVMFGVPSGAIWDPADTTDEILDGYVLAPHDLAAWPPRPGAQAGVGRVEALVVAPAAEAPVVLIDEAVAIAGRGLQGDRYAAGAGTFASGRPGSALTLVDAAVLDTFARDVDHRVCSQRSIEAVLRAAAIQSRKGASVATAARSPASASSSTAARSRHRSQRSRRSGARSPQPVHTPIVLPRRRSHAAQMAPLDTPVRGPRGAAIQARHDRRAPTGVGEADRSPADDHGQQHRSQIDSRFG